MNSQYLSAKQAAQKLGVSLSTLYAYVSRGMIRSEPDSVKRRRRYRAEDVEALLARKSDRILTERKLAGALSWGEPICESELTLIQDGELFYRGHPVAELALSATYEEVGAILWQDFPPVETVVIPQPLRDLVSERGYLERFSLILAWMSGWDERGLDLRPQGVRRTGARILGGLFSTLCDLEPGKSLVQCLAQAWETGRRELETALIVCADHELNVSAFSARCVASAGASPYQVVLAGLAALSGFRHGGYSHRVAALFREAENLGPEEAIRSYLRRGVSPPGFGHQLYPQGDPRGRILLQILGEPDPVAEGLRRACLELLDEHPNVDFGLAALSRKRNLPPGAALALFGLGRCLGWLAHALEQYATERLIRPRARYVGVLPQ